MIPLMAPEVGAGAQGSLGTTGGSPGRRAADADPFLMGVNGRVHRVHCRTQDDAAMEVCPHAVPEAKAAVLPVSP
jgi:hypothetical protein